MFERSMSHVHSCTDNRRDNIENYMYLDIVFTVETLQKIWQFVQQMIQGTVLKTKKNPRKFTDDLKQVTFEQKLFIGIK